MLDRCFFMYFLNVFISRAYQSTAQTFKGRGDEIVDRVVLCSNRNGNMCVKFRTRHTHRPEVKSFSVYCETVFFSGSCFIDFFVCICCLRLVIHLVADMDRKVFVEQSFSRKTYHFLRMAFVQI